MKKFLILLLAVVFASCGVSRRTLCKTDYLNVRSENNYISAKITPDEKGNYVYTDTNVTISASVRLEYIPVAVHNNTNQMMNLVWNDASLIYPNSKAVLVFNEKTLAVDADRSNKLATPIPGHSYVDFTVFPRTSCDRDVYEYGMFPYVSKSLERLKNVTNPYLGKELRLILPIKIDNKTMVYELIFHIDRFDFV